MVIDSSVLAAVVLGEPDAERYVQAMQRHEPLSVSAATLLESRIVVEARQGPDATRDLDLLVDQAVVAVQPVDAHQADIAFAAWRRFGKGRHPAGLNFGDCFAYALASVLDEPLLFKGEDFAATDVRAALA